MYESFCVECIRTERPSKICGASTWTCTAVYASFKNRNTGRYFSSDKYWTRTSL